MGESWTQLAVGQNSTNPLGQIPKVREPARSVATGWLDQSEIKLPKTGFIEIDMGRIRYRTPRHIIRQEDMAITVMIIDQKRPIIGISFDLGEHHAELRPADPSHKDQSQQTKPLPDVLGAFEMGGEAGGVHARIITALYWGWTDLAYCHVMRRGYVLRL